MELALVPVAFTLVTLALGTVALAAAALICTTYNFLCPTS